MLPNHLILELKIIVERKKGMRSFILNFVILQSELYINSDQPLSVPALQTNKKDNSSGGETAESLRLMPLELRDELLASDYLKLPLLK